MNESINIPDNGCTWLHDALIDTEAWLQSIGEEVEWIDNPSSADPFGASTDSPAVRHGVELIHAQENDGEADYRHESTDNVYNHENQFSEMFGLTRQQMPGSSIGA